MDAIKGNINSILNGFKQFIIPVYQRTYSWKIEQCYRLWNDIVDMQKKNRTGHFVGSIVNVTEQAMPTGVQKYMIIDGQQRMTTLTLLLIALRDYGYQNKDKVNINPQIINGMCIQNDYSSGLDKYKILLTQGDREVLIKLIDRLPLDDVKNSILIDNYKFFLDNIKKGLMTPKEIYEGIGKLKIVNITLDRAVDNPQLIFESLNSTGVDLSESDLIRNYVLMGLEANVQSDIYNRSWFPMEKLFDYENQSVLMDKFFRDYLTLNNSKIPKLNKIYEEFKEYHQKKVDNSMEEICKELYINAKYYTSIYFANSGDTELDFIFNDIKALQMEVAMPFLLKVFKDYKSNFINKAEFIEILKICESYVFRRAICGIPTNSLNKTFMTICNKINKENYLNSVKAYFILLDTYKIFPREDNFIENFKVKDIYNMRIRNYILSKIENYDNKAPINIENFTIEHIMPQNKSPIQAWKDSLGDNWKEAQKIFIHTIGNLTLTAYNSEMSDKSFEDKLNMKGGFKESALRINRYVVKQNTWSKEKIQERAVELSELATKIWIYPELCDEELEKFSPKSNQALYNLNDYEYLTDDNIHLFEVLDKRIFNLSFDVRKEYTKLYIAYKLETNFVDIVPQKSKLRLSINMKFDEINDPKGICNDVSEKGRWGNGEGEIYYTSIDQLDDIMDIIYQSYTKQVE